MKIILSKLDAVIALHEQGFTADFQLFGSDLLWVQEKIFIRMPDFAITDYYRFCERRHKANDEIVFGIVSLRHHVKGILLNDYASRSVATPAVIEKKLQELALQQQPSLHFYL